MRGSNLAGVSKTIKCPYFVRVVTGGPDSARLAVECRGKSCPFAWWRDVMSAQSTSNAKKATKPAKPPDANLTRLFRGKPLALGTQVIASLTAPKTIARYVGFTITSNKKGPRAALNSGCMPPGFVGPTDKPCSPKIPGQTPSTRKQMSGSRQASRR